MNRNYFQKSSLGKVVFHHPICESESRLVTHDASPPPILVALKHRPKLNESSHFNISGFLQLVNVNFSGEKSSTQS